MHKTLATCMINRHITMRFGILESASAREVNSFDKEKSVVVV